MANGYSPKNIVAPGLKPISGIVTGQAISQDAGLNWGSCARLRLDIEVTGVTVVGAITATLQDRSPTSGFVSLAGANATATITANGRYTITQLVERSADQPNIPIRKQIRIVLTTTNAGDAVTVNAVYIYQEL